MSLMLPQQQNINKETAKCKPINIIKINLFKCSKKLSGHLKEKSRNHVNLSLHNLQTLAAETLASVYTIRQPFEMCWSLFASFFSLISLNNQDQKRQKYQKVYQHPRFALPFVCTTYMFFSSKKEPAVCRLPQSQMKTWISVSSLYHFLLVAS